jgi:hypothetical protein
MKNWNVESSGFWKSSGAKPLAFIGKFFFPLLLGKRVALSAICTLTIMSLSFYIYRDYLHERGDKEIVISEWQVKEAKDAYIGESFSQMREIKYDRSREGMGIGPKSVPVRFLRLM